MATLSRAQYDPTKIQDPESGRSTNIQTMSGGGSDPTRAGQQNPVTSNMGAGKGSGPVPWWVANQQQGGRGTAPMDENAPSGYKYDPVEMKYVRTPISQGQDQAASLKGLYGGLNGGISKPDGGDYQSTMGPYGGAGSAFGLYGFGGPGSGGSGGFGMPGGTPATMASSATLHLGANQSPTIHPEARPDTIQGKNQPGNIAHIQGPDQSAANAAIFAKAKDQVGETSRGAIQGLAGAMAGRGIVGSGVEGRGQLGAVREGQQQLGETSRGLAVKDADIAEQNALASYQGDITQRGQNLQNDQTNTGFGVTQRGQDMASMSDAQNSLVTQRGQDMSMQGLEFQGGITQRGQDFGREAAQGQLGLGYADLAQRRYSQAMAGLNKGYGGQGAY